MSKTPIIEFKDFSFRYQSQVEPTLKNINLTIYQGEKVLILGPSGCGKSTLASCINGLIPHSFKGEISGECKIAGVDTSTSSIFKLSNTVGTVLQDSDAQFVGLSVGEDIAYSLENDCCPREEMLVKVYDSASLVHMQSFLAHLPYHLSGGQKQSVSLAGILHGDVKILLFDEPLAALDPQMGNQAIDLIDEIKKKTDKTVVIIEHRLEDVLYRSIDRIILMNDGQIISDTTPDELLCSNLLKENGIREPLYITALKMANCSFSIADHPSDINNMDLSKHYEKLVQFFSGEDSCQNKVNEHCVVEVNHVDFAYDDVKAIDDVSFKIHQGERVALIGKNGAGKTTIAKLICGIIRPQKGDIYINGENYLKYSIKEIGQKIGYVMQNPNQMLVKDVIKEEVSLGLTLNGYSQEEIDKKVELALKTCDLYSMRNWPVSVVSYGQKKRITIASILAMQPSLIILDEPTAGQDYKVYTEVMSFIKKLNKEYGITILFITHDMHLAIEYTDRAIVFADGKVVDDDSVYKILANDEVIKKANLKQTSLYLLAKRLNLSAEKFIDRFISLERSNHHE